MNGKPLRVHTNLGVKAPKKSSKYSAEELCDNGKAPLTLQQKLSALLLVRSTSELYRESSSYFLKASWSFMVSKRAVLSPFHSRTHGENS